MTAAGDVTPVCCVNPLVAFPQPIGDQWINATDHVGLLDGEVKAGLHMSPQTPNNTLVNFYCCLKL